MNDDYNVGKVLDVSETWAGSEVTQDYAAGATVLNVYSTIDYSDQGGDVTIGDLVYPYNTKDEEASTVTLASALTVDIAQDDEVLIYPLALVKEAMVQIDDEDADLIRVPQSLYDALPLGIRTIAQQETVLVSAYGDSEILDIVNQELVRDGTYIDPTTLPVSGSDGVPPPPVGVVTIFGGIGMLFLSWDAVDDAELVTYDVYIDTTANFIPSPLNLAGSTDATVFNVNLEPGTYYAQVIARDSDGEAPPSGEVSDEVIAAVDTAAIQAEIDANTAKVNERPRVVFATTQPTVTADEKVTWYDTDNGYAASYWDGTAWSPYALSTGALAANAITTSLLADSAIVAAKIAANAVTTSAIAPNAITSTLIADGAIIAAKVGANAITTAAIAANAITTAQIVADAVTASQIATGAVGSGELATGAVIAGKITAGTIVAGDIATGAITAGKIAADAVTATEIAAGAVSASELTAGAVIAGKIGALAISAGDISAGAIIAGKIATDAVTAGSIAAGTVSASELTAGAVVAGKIGALAIAAGDISAGAIIAGKVAAGAISTTELASDSVISAKIAAGTIVASDIATDTITASQIATNAITSAEITGGAITAVKIAAGTITANEIASGTITATQIASGTITSTQIAAGTITASLLSATAIDGKTITGALVRTAGSGNRVQVYSSGGVGYIDFYGTSALRGQLVATDSGSGAMTMYGSSGSNSYISLGPNSIVMAGLGGLTIFAPITVSNGGISADVNYTSYFGNLRSNGNFIATGGVTCDDVGAGGGLTDGTYIGQGTTGANINNNGRVTRVSTETMKKAIKPMTKKEAHSVLGLESFTFEYKKGKYDAIPDPRRYPGFIAEQAAKAGAELFVARQHDVDRDPKTRKIRKVTRNQKGKPVGFRTEAVTVAHNVLIKELFQEVESMREQIAELKRDLTSK